MGKKVTGTFGNGEPYVMESIEEPVFEDMPEITIDAEGGGVVEVVPSIIEAHFPVFSAEGVLLNPGECEVDKDGIVRGKVV
jgi:hypothetical protein